MSRLSHERLLGVHHIVTVTSGAPGRDALLAGIPRPIVASLPVAQSPGEQILNDLSTLSQLTRLPDGADPLRTWLQNAVALLGGRVEAEIVQDALDELAAPRGPTAPPLPPPPHTLPARRTFLGRETELSAVENALGPTAGPPRPVTLYGLAGSGKTALALEYAHRHVHEYPGGTFWLHAESGPLDAFVQLAMDMRRIALPGVREILKREPSDAKAVDLARAAKLALQSQNEPSLLVLDNVEAAAKDWLPYLPGGHVHVLATARDKRLFTGQSLLVSSLPDAEGEKLAFAIAAEPRDAAERDAARRVLHELGGLPVAVTMAARMVEAWLNSWIAYERHLRVEIDRVLDEPELLDDYPRGAVAALDVSIDRFPVGSAARRLLEAAAVFAPDDIPLAWAIAAAGLEQGHLDTARAPSLLAGAGLFVAQRDADVVSVHRLVRMRVRSRTDRSNWGTISARAGTDVGEWLRKTVDPTRIAEVDERRHHVFEVLRAVEEAEQHREFLIIVQWIATHLEHRAEHAAARDLFKRALAKAEMLQPPDPKQVTRALSNLALALHQEGCLDEARLLLERSLKLAESLYGPEHPKVASRLSSLGTIMQESGDLVKSQELHERALVITERTCGPVDLRLVPILSNLATALCRQGRAQRAKLLFDRALDIATNVYGQNHPRVAVILSNMAEVAQDPGWIAATAELVAIRDRYGRRDTAYSSADFWFMQDSMKVRIGQLERTKARKEHAAVAHNLLTRALSIDESAYGSDHPTVARRLFELGLVLDTLEDKRALPALQRATNIFLRTCLDEGAELLSMLRRTACYLSRPNACDLLHYSADTAIQVSKHLASFSVRVHLVHQGMTCPHAGDAIPTKNPPAKPVDLDM